ncbi:MAG: diguanylate cyclase [Treponemataceae bacterium]
MGIVNNRYKIIREIHQDSTNKILSFMVLDLLTENTTLGLSIIKIEDLPAHSEKFIKENFAHISTMHSDRFFKNYEFGRTDFEINGTNKKVYYFTHEINEYHLSLYDFINPFNISDILNAVVQICQCQNLAIINGYLQPVNRWDDFFAINEGDEFSVKARDLISISINSKNQNYDYRFEDIANLFLSLFDGYSKTKNIFENIEHIRELYSELFLIEYEKKVLDCILKVCENIYLGKYGNIIYVFYYKLLADINKELNSFFYADVDDANSYVIKHPRLYNEEKNVTSIINEITDTNLKSKHKCFLITGNLGTGKTTFLSDLSFLLNFEDVDTYLIEIESLSYRFFLKLLSQILDKYPMLKSEVDLNDIYLHIKNFSSGNKEHFESKFIVIEKINNIIKKASTMRPQIIIADNLEFADRFTLEFIFSNITQDLTGYNTFFIFSFSKYFGNSEKYFEDACKELLKHPSCLEIKLNLLTELETAILIKNMLGMQDAPVLTSKEINKITGGNQFFTVQLISELLDLGELWKNREDGFWEIKTDAYQIAHFFKTPKVIIKLAKKVFEKYFALNLNILKTISIFQLYIKKAFVKELVQDIKESEVEKLFDNFIKNNFLSEIKNGVYHIDEKILQSTFYSLLTEPEKKRLHMRALEILKKEKDEVFYDEILIHYDYLGEEETVLNLLLTKARNEVKIGCYQNAVVNYEKAMVALDNYDADIVMKVGTELGVAYLNLGNLDFSMEILRSLENIVSKVSNQKVLLMFYVAYAELYYKLIDKEKFYELLKEIKKIPHQELELNEDEKNLISKIYIFENMFDNNTKLTFKNLSALISRIEQNNGNKKMLSELYRFMGNIKINERDVKATQKYYHLSYENAKKYNDLQNMLSSLNNLANLNVRFFENLELAEQIYLKALEVSSNLGFGRNILVSYINLSSLYYDMEQFEKSRHYLNLISEKVAPAEFLAKDLTFFMQLLNYALLSENNEYDKALILQNKLLVKLENTSLIFFSADIYVQFHCGYARLNLTFGRYSEAIENLKTALAKNSNIQTTKALNFLIDMIDVLLHKNNTGVRKLKKTLPSLIKEFSPRQKIRFLKMILNVLSHSVAVRCFDLFTELALSVVKICGNDFEKYTRSNVRLQIVKFQLDKNKQSFYINQILFALKDKKAPLTKAVLKQQLAFSHFQNQQCALGIMTLINVQNLIRDFMVDVPIEMQIEVFNFYSFGVPFKIVYEFIEKGKIQIDENIFNRNVSAIGFKRLLNSNDLALLSKSTMFLRMLSSEVFYENNDVLKYKSISRTLQHFTSDTETNIILLLNLLMQKIFALHSNILITNTNGNQSFLFPSRASSFSFFDYEEVLKKFGFSEIAKMLDKYGFDIIEVPIDTSKNISDKNYTLIFFVQKDVYILAKTRLKYCKRLIPLLMTLLQNYTLNNLLRLEQSSGTTYIYDFEQTLTSSINYSSVESTNVIVAYFRVENLKVIDFLFGQQHCDKIVKDIVAIVNGLLTKNDLIARYAKDEFAILFYNADKNNVIKKVDEIKEKALALEHQNIDLITPLTFGIASLDDDGVSFLNILNKAYIAMLYASDLGVNKTSLYLPSYESSLIGRPVFSEFYSGKGTLAFNKINCIIELLIASSAYVSKNAMLNLFLQKLLYFIDAETASFLYAETFQDNYASNYKVALQKDCKKIITVKSDKNLPDVEVNTSLLKRASENSKAFFTDEVKLEKIGDLDFPNWQSVLVCPITKGYTTKGFFYLTTSAKKEHFTNDDLAFALLVGFLLGKEL